MEKSVKESVVESYGELARSTKSGLMSKLFACCDPSDNANEVGKTIGYSEEILNSVPKGSNLGVGCGNPSALANIQNGETVIDLGSGAGFDAFIVSSLVKNNGKVIGVDLSDEMLELANENAKKGNYSCKLPLISTVQISNIIKFIVFNSNRASSIRINFGVFYWWYFS